MKQAIWQESYRINSYLVNLRGKAGLYAVLNLIQDVGWQHAFHLQIELPANLGWVMTRQKLTVSDWPRWNETLTVRTWLRPPTDTGFLFRDYELLIGEKKIGEATTTLVTIDYRSRKMATQDWSSYEKVWRTEGCLETVPDKISVGEKAEELATFHVRNSDIDMNQHVNNTKYAQWILDALPIEVLKKGAELLGYEVNFLAETVLGDRVSVQRETPPVGEKDVTEVRFQGIRSADAKKVFTVEMIIRP